MPKIPTPMGRILFAAPTIERFHLVDQVARQVLRRGHDPLVLTADPVTNRFYDAQGMPTLELRSRGTAHHPRAPMDEFALRDCRLENGGRDGTGLNEMRRARQALQRMVGPVLRFFETSLPDVVVICDARSGLHQLIHFIATEFGCEVLHLGAGLVAGTLQIDPQGIDGDSSMCLRPGGFYREQTADEEFLCTALAAAIAGVPRSRGPQRRLFHPDWIDRLASVADGLGRRRVGEAIEKLTAWDRISATGSRAPLDASLPSEPIADPPFLAVLLQPDGSPRLCLDVNKAPLCTELIEAARSAARSHGDLQIVVVPAAHAGDDRAELEATIRRCAPDVVLAGPAAGPATVCTAAAVVSVNDPRGLLAILAGTPVVHLGRTPYGVPGIATRATLDTLARALSTAAQADAPSLTRRFATRMLTVDHVWCDADQPDTNGLRGIVLEIERRLRQVESHEPLRYVADPGPTAL